MLLPFAASAHEGAGLKIGANIHAGTTVGHQDNDNEGSKGKHEQASTTVKTVAQKVARINATASFMSALSPILSARIASSTLSASSTATANAHLADYNTSIVSAKAQVSVASVTADNLKAARDFLNTARQDLMSIVHAIFNA